MQLCSERVTATDFSSLDGCGFLLETQDGRKLLPSNLATFTTSLENGEQLTVSYIVDTESASICMSEDEIVTLTCFQRLDQKIDCEPMVDPFEPEWSKAVMTTLDPYRIEEYVVGDQRWYLYHSEHQLRWYACTGDLLCSYGPGEQAICDLDINPDELKIIYVQDQTP